MEKLVIALGPAFVAGFAVQRLLELLDPLYPILGDARRPGSPLRSIEDFIYRLFHPRASRTSNAPDHEEDYPQEPDAAVPTEAYVKAASDVSVQVTRQQAQDVASPSRSADDEERKKKALVLGYVSLMVGVIFVLFTSIRVAKYVIPEGSGVIIPDAVDAAITALIISAGTEGVNSVLKFLGYAKDNQKAPAA